MKLKTMITSVVAGTVVVLSASAFAHKKNYEV